MFGSSSICTLVRLCLLSFCDFWFVVLFFFGPFLSIEMASSADNICLVPGGGVPTFASKAAVGFQSASGVSGDGIGDSTRRLLSSLSGRKPKSNVGPALPGSSGSGSTGGAPVTTTPPTLTARPWDAPFPGVGRRHGVRVQSLPSIGIESYVVEMA